MGAESKIEWTDATVNFWWGCTKVGPGCDHCYAESFDKRVGGAHWGTGIPRRQIASAAHTLAKLNRQGGKRVFIQSMSDLFDNDVTPDWFNQAWMHIHLAKDCRIQIVTKRVSNVEKIIARSGFPTWPAHAGLMITVVNQAEADRDIPRLLALKAKLGIPWVGLSMEPLLGPVDLGRWIASANVTCKACRQSFWLHDANPCDHAESGAWTLACPNCGDCRCKPGWTPADARHIQMEPPTDWLIRSVGRFDKVHPTIALSSMIDWVIVGGESGHKARPMHPDWARSLRDQCQAAGVPFFFKQWGEYSCTYDRDAEDPDWRHCDIVARRDQPGQWLNLAGGQGFHGERVVRMRKVGKARAGRLLDGREWNDMPGALTAHG